MVNMNKIIFLIVIALLLASCTPAIVGKQEDDIGYFADNIHRWHDREAGVVCWVFYAYRVSGISCLPIEDTNLK